MSEFVYDEKDNCVFFFFGKAPENPKAPTSKNPLRIDGTPKEAAMWVSLKQGATYEQFKALVSNIRVNISDPFVPNSQRSEKPQQTIADVTIDRSNDDDDGVSF